MEARGDGPYTEWMSCTVGLPLPASINLRFFLALRRSTRLIINSDSMDERTAVVQLLAAEGGREGDGVDDGGEMVAVASSKNMLGWAKLGAGAGVAVTWRLGWK